MYSNRMKESFAILYTRQAVDRAKRLPIEDLENEVRNYEEASDTRGIFPRFLDDILGVDEDMYHTYQINKRVLSARKNNS